MKSAEEIMEILEGFDLTASYRDAAELAGCSPNTVAHWVAMRDAGTLVPGRAERRPSVIDKFLPKLEEFVDRSKGKIRADVAHDKITTMGFGGSERTTRRAVAEIKKSWRSGRRRVHQQSTPGNPRVDDTHFPPAPAGALARTRDPGPPARRHSWVGRRCGAVVDRGRRGRRHPGAGQDGRGGRAGPLHGDTVVDRALGQAGLAGRFAEGDVAAILSHQASATPGPAARAGEDHTLAQGTTGWAGFGEPGFGETEVTR